MNNLKLFIVLLHKYLGTLMSALFLMWSLTGFVLLFAGFPHASRQERFEKLEALSRFSRLDSLPQNSSVGLKLEMYNGQPIFRISQGRKKEQLLQAATHQVLTLDFASCKRAAERFCAGEIVHCDTIKKLDTWIPWSYYKALLPFYKFYYSDTAHAVVYVSSVTGNVIQETTRKTRWLARLGAIPHWVYFKRIKSQAVLHRRVIMVLGIIGFLACLSGLILGLMRLKRNAKGQIVGLSVFKKHHYRFHHIFGLFFGLLLTTYILSGMFYYTGIPSWMVKKQEGASPSRQWNKEDNMASLSPQDVFAQLQDTVGLRQIEWSGAMGVPVVKAYYDDYQIAQVYRVDSSGLMSAFVASKQDVLAKAKILFPTMEVVLSQQSEYDFFYEQNAMYYHPLPVWKLTLNSSYNDVLYIDPSTGECEAYFNNNKRARRILTKTLHKLELPILYRYNTLRIVVSVFVLIFCVVISYTSVVLGIRFMKRKIKR